MEINHITALILGQLLSCAESGFGLPVDGVLSSALSKFNSADSPTINAELAALVKLYRDTTNPKQND